MLNHTFAGFDPIQLGRAIQLIIQKLHHLFGFRHELPLWVLLQIRNKCLLRFLKPIHIRIIVSHIEVAFRHGRIHNLQHMRQNGIGSFVISLLR
ncbi:hypothetical protein D3C76_1665730 [compost metagenome]